MKDIQLAWDLDLGEGDLVTTQNAGDLGTDEALTTAVLISIFTDKRARDDDPLPDPDSTDKRGWWGDLLEPDPSDDEIGSRVWIFAERAKATEQVLSDVKNALEECLQWMIDDGVVSDTEVIAEKVGSSLYFQISIKKINNTTNTYSVKFDANWNSQFNIVS